MSLLLLYTRLLCFATQISFLSNFSSLDTDKSLISDSFKDTDPSDDELLLKAVVGLSSLLSNSDFCIVVNISVCSVIVDNWRTAVCVGKSDGGWLDDCCDKTSKSSSLEENSCSIKPSGLLLFFC